MNTKHYSPRLVRHTKVDQMMMILVLAVVICLASSPTSIVQAVDERQEQPGGSGVNIGGSLDGGLSSSSSSSSGASMSGSVGTSGSLTAAGVPSTADIQKQLQQLLAFASNPVTTGVKYVMPNAYSGAQTDLTNGYYAMSKGLVNGYNGLTSTVMDRYQAIENGVLNRMTQQLKVQEQLMNRMYELVMNPEQICKQVADRTKAGLEQTNHQVQQAAESAGLFMRKLSHYGIG